MGVHLKANMMYYHVYLLHGNKYTYHCVITQPLQNGQTLGQFFELLYPCILIHWFSKINEELDIDTGMWWVEPDFNLEGEPLYTVIHLDTMICAAHLIGEPNRPTLHTLLLWTSLIHSTSTNTLIIMHTRSHFSYLLLVVSGLSFTCYLSLNYSHTRQLRLIIIILYLYCTKYYWYNFLLAVCISLAALVKPLHLRVLSLQGISSLQGQQVHSSPVSHRQALKDFPGRLCLWLNCCSCRYLNSFAMSTGT